jgi:hypothetical protein
MAQNGELNTKFGVYRSICCKSEIVIAEGVKFPDCPNHIKLTTEWKLVVETPNRVVHISEHLARKKSNPAA